MKTVEKPWGREEIIETNDRYTLKKLKMFKGHKCSMQYHEYKKETIYVLEGVLKVYVGHSLDHLNIIYLNESDTITIDPYMIHRMEAENDDAVYLESSTSELDDVVRIQDEYNRESVAFFNNTNNYKSKCYTICRNINGKMICANDINVDLGNLEQVSYGDGLYITTGFVKEVVGRYNQNGSWDGNNFISINYPDGTPMGFATTSGY